MQGARLERACAGLPERVAELGRSRELARVLRVENAARSTARGRSERTDCARSRRAPRSAPSTAAIGTPRGSPRRRSDAARTAARRRSRSARDCRGGSGSRRDADRGARARGAGDRGAARALSARRASEVGPSRSPAPGAPSRSRAPRLLPRGAGRARARRAPPRPPRSRAGDSALSPPASAIEISSISSLEPGSRAAAPAPTSAISAAASSAASCPSSCRTNATARARSGSRRTSRTSWRANEEVPLMRGADCRSSPPARRPGRTGRGAWPRGLDAARRLWQSHGNPCP